MIFEHSWFVKHYNWSMFGNHVLLRLREVRILYSKHIHVVDLFQLISVSKVKMIRPCVYFSMTWKIDCVVILLEVKAIVLLFSSLGRFLSLLMVLVNLFLRFLVLCHFPHILFVKLMFKSETEINFRFCFFFLLCRLLFLKKSLLLKLRWRLRSLLSALLSAIEKICIFINGKILSVSLTAATLTWGVERIFFLYFPNC